MCTDAPAVLAVQERDDQKILAENSRDLADTGEYRAFLVSDIELPTDQPRVDQENQIVQCMGHGGPHR